MQTKILALGQDLKIIGEIEPILRNEGYEIVLTSSVEAVLKLCKTESFDLVLIDFHGATPAYSHLISKIKKISEDTEIIIITGDTLPEALAQTEMEEITSFLMLPLTPQKAKNVVNLARQRSRLVKENRRLLLAVRAAKKEWEAIVDAIEDPIFVTDFDYNILRANLTTFRTLGKGVKEILGHKCYEIFHSSNVPGTDCPGKKARNSGEPDTDTLFFKGLGQRLTCRVYPQVFASGGGLVHYLHEPTTPTQQEAETMTKYERLFDDARIPILLIDLEDYKIIDANQMAIQLLGAEPEQLLNVDLEDIFIPSARETTMEELIELIQKGKGSIRSKIAGAENREIAVYITGNILELGINRFWEIFLIPADLFL